MSGAALLSWMTALVLAPALPGVVQKTKAILAGRRGAPVLQLYFDLWKLSRKATVVSRTSTGLLPVLPAAVLTATILAGVLVPLGSVRALLRFPGDFLAFAGLLAFGRYGLVLMGLESGSSFQGMGASRDVTLATFSEPALLLCFACLALSSRSQDLSGLVGAGIAGRSMAHAPAFLLVAAALFLLLLAECAQVPVDDPATHLELTMIHEVVLLDVGGPDLAFALYAAAVKFSILAGLVTMVAVPELAASGRGPWWVPLGMVLVASAVGVVAGLSVRLRMNRLPQFLTAAIVLASLALALVLR